MMEPDDYFEEYNDDFMDDEEALVFFIYLFFQIASQDHILLERTIS